jgi:hypothetical protein
VEAAEWEFLVEHADLALVWNVHLFDSVPIIGAHRLVCRALSGFIR